MWSLRVKEFSQRVAQKSVIPAEQKNEMLRESFGDRYTRLISRMLPKLIITKQNTFRN